MNAVHLQLRSGNRRKDRTDAALPFREFYLHDIAFEEMNDAPRFEFDFTLTEKNKKKAEQIKQMIGKVSTLEAAAAALKDSIVTVDSLRISSREAGKISDPKVLGAVFNISNKGKVISEPIAGSEAVYVVRVDDLTTTSVAIADIEMQKAQMRQRAKQMQSFYSSPIKLLREQATIKDNRRNFY